MLKDTMQKLRHFADKPVSITSMVYFRIILGGIFAWESYRYLSKGWINWLFAEVPFHLVHPGFGWLPDFSGPVWHIYWALMGVLAIFITLGLFYRFSIITFTFLFTYQYLLTQENYLNHFYFSILILLPLCFSSPHLAFSLDRRLKRVKPSSTIPMWQHAIICFLMGCVYFYGGIAKIDPDWLTGVPMNNWLNPQKDLPYIGSFLTSEWCAVLMSWAGFLLDLLIVPFLLWKRSRVLALITISAFHLSNSWLFNIGIFPWFSIGTTLLYLGPQFPGRFIKNLFPNKELPWKNYPQREFKLPNWGFALLVFFISYNLLIPLRYHFMEGDPHWTERGHSYSWRMKLRNKSLHELTFFFKDRETGKKWEHSWRKWLSHKQMRAVGKRPDLMLTFVDYLKDYYRKQGVNDLRIRAKVVVSLNYRKPERLITYRYNLDQAKDCLICQPDWITPGPKRSFKDSWQRFQKRREKELSKKNSKDEG